ncbi:hypothetical protein SCLCIDRAFT_30298 [Scleroderma citrinum Foug A]|uniref:Uncharacterized protein n=1 Tax=Scleroderma citrinum Foug A TaxID=1036808 RepID=A0A0C3DGM2_9AGAM|nr:hypothetical protein SCLCIDRAFT_30298 [Scleroderma citrinum Foug A]
MSFSAVTIHLEVEGEGLVIPLDIVEVARSHTGAVLADKFTKVLENFGVADKVSTSQFNEEERSPCFFLEDFERDV